MNADGSTSDSLLPFLHLAKHGSLKSHVLPWGGLPLQLWQTLWFSCCWPLPTSFGVASRTEELKSSKLHYPQSLAAQVLNVIYYQIEALTKGFGNKLNGETSRVRGLHFKGADHSQGVVGLGSAAKMSAL